MTFSVRTRLTIWNGLVTAVIVIGLGAVVYVAMAAALLERVDAVLLFEYEETVERLQKLGVDDDLGSVPEAFLEQFLLRVSDEQGSVRMQSPMLQKIHWELPLENASEQAQFITTDIPGIGQSRVIYGQLDGVHAGWTVQVATRLTAYARQLNELQRILFSLVPVALLVATIAGYVSAGRALAPVAKITETTRRISATNLDERVNAGRVDDEMGRLAATINSMLDRLTETMNAMRQFTADASHEFMTPLAQIRAETELALQQVRSQEEYQEVLNSTLEEVARLTNLAQQLLSLAREDAATQGGEPETFELQAVVRAAVAGVQGPAEAASVQVAMDAAVPTTVTVDPDRLRQVVENLLHNAIRYNRPGGEVHVRIQPADQQVVVSVADTGIGIATEELPRIFDRFYRVDKARSRQFGGAGLGLSIAKTLTESMGGRLEVESTPGSGSTFRIVLPRS